MEEAAIPFLGVSGVDASEEDAPPEPPVLVIAEEALGPHAGQLVYGFEVQLEAPGDARLCGNRLPEGGLRLDPLPGALFRECLARGRVGIALLAEGSDAPSSGPSLDRLFYGVARHGTGGHKR